MNYYTLVIIAAMIASFCAVKWAYFKILKIAKEKNLVDNPDARKLQKTPIPVLGGIAVFVGVTAGMLMASTLVNSFELQKTAYLIPVLMSMVVMLYIGAMDDILGLTPKSRFLIEILVILGLIYGGGGCVDSLHGVFGVGQFSWWIGVPLTVFAGLGIINAVNMVDGVNGLSSGLCIAVASLFGVVFIESGDTSNAILAFIMVASLIPFYIHNVFGNTSRMFIGDAGTMVMGIVLVWFTISILRSDTPVAYNSTNNELGLVAMTIAIMVVPIADTLRVMTMRMVHGKSPFSADKTHLHHVFIAAGVSHFITSTSVILIDLVVAACWVLSVMMGLSVTCQLFLVIVLGMIFVWGTYAFIRYNEKKHTKFMHWLSKVSVSTHLGRKEWWKSISAWLDAPEGEIHEEKLLDDDMKKVHDPLENHNLVMSYLKGKAEVHVSDIKMNSGADRSSVYPILYELERKGTINVYLRGEYDTPEIVALISGGGNL